MTPAPTPIPFCSLPPMIIPSAATAVPLLPPTARSYYTDGSHSATSGGHTLLGAAFYYAPTQRTYLVNPGGVADTRTILRAELAAIASALTHATSHHPTDTIYLFTDSLCSLHLIQRIVRAPRTLTESKHYPLLLDIRSALSTRIRAGAHTFLHKVRSHTDIRGNDAADAGAASAAASPSSCEFSISHPTQFHTLPAWPCLVPSAALPRRSPHFFSDLTMSIKTFLLGKSSITSPGPPPPTYARLLDLPSPLPCPSNRMWHTSSCTFSQIRNILLIRFSQLWTSARAASRGLPYAHISPCRPPGSCPICPHTSDTTGHILGGCSHPHLKALYISRHNSALRLLHRAVLAGSLANSVIILDACSRVRLPVGVYGTRLPTWLLPSVPSALLKKLRPDMLVIQGLSPFQAPAPTDVLSPSALAVLKRRCVIHILELGYCHESLYLTTRAAKQTQHLQLLHLLRRSGWRLAPVPIHVVIIGTSGVLFSPLLASMRSLGVPPCALPPPLTSLHVASVRFASDIVIARRLIESSAPHPAAPILLDPP